MYGYAYIQWKIALARMHDANMAATEITTGAAYQSCRPPDRRVSPEQIL